jgi:osmotically inducible lipoprotein OsmB
MNNARKTFIASSFAAAAFALAGCSGMSQQDKNTATGAAIGGVAGSVLTNGGTLGTVGGAVVGGAIGRNVDKDKR